ncbi:metalloregulator ArsR/SmtB family transcription factor [Ruminococcaceae bacterium OttesenSCG-928-A11]|nr:metalloregulator ArsR/SmtB family transcription factor [Ruminococcaceae bacterium OttesenSCG-928-A11]
MKYAHAEYALVFKAMSDETRLKILCQLRGGEELCACNILESFSITQPTLSYHMKLLTESGLVNARKDANWMRYTINMERVDELQQFLDGLKTPPDSECCPGGKCEC